MNNKKYKRISIFAGHYGSGKTNIAVNFAIQMKKDGLNVKIADLDIVNPYFRTKDSAEELAQAGVELISPAFANTNVDLPALPQEIYGLVQNKNFYAVFDVGGDDRGAYALGRYTPYILEEDNYDMYFVVNFYRPLTTNAQEAYEIMQEIQAVSKIPFTAIINNSNLANETTAEDILNTQQEAEKLSRMANIPIVMTTVREDIFSSLNIDGKMPLRLQKKIL